MTDLRISGVVREALFTENGIVEVAGVVREALISGTGLSGRISGRAAAAATATIFAGADVVIAGGTAKTQGRIRIAQPAMTVPLFARASPRGAARLAQIPLRFNVAGRMTARSAGRIAELNVRVVSGRVTSRSAGRTSAIVARPDANRQYSVTINAR